MIKDGSGINTEQYAYPKELVTFGIKILIKIPVSKFFQRFGLSISIFGHRKYFTLRAYSYIII